MAKEKNKPVPVRFNLKVLETLKEEEKIDTPQQALNFLTNFWENNRPAKTGFEAGLKELPVPDAAAKIANTAAPVPTKAKEGKKKEGGPTEAPPGLSGIDLSIWKAEQKEKR